MTLSYRITNYGLNLTLNYSKGHQMLLFGNNWSKTKGFFTFDLWWYITIIWFISPRSSMLLYVFKLLPNIILLKVFRRICMYWLFNQCIYQLFNFISFLYHIKWLLILDNSQLGLRIDNMKLWRLVIDTGSNARDLGLLVAVKLIVVESPRAAGLNSERRWALIFLLNLAGE